MREKSYKFREELKDIKEKLLLKFMFTTKETI